MTLNGKMALILHYFTEFVYDVVVKQLLGLPRFQNLLLIYRLLSRVRTIPVLGIGQYLPVLGGIGTILFLVIVPNTGQTTVRGTHDDLISGSAPCEIRCQQLICHASRLSTPGDAQTTEAA